MPATSVRADGASIAIAEQQQWLLRGMEKRRLLLALLVALEGVELEWRWSLVKRNICNRGLSNAINSVSLMERVGEEVITYFKNTQESPGTLLWWF